MTPTERAPNSGLRPGFFLTARAWLDNDGRHVWLAHDCATERVATMLPWPNWHSTGLRVEPSFMCDDCGIHTSVELGVPDEGQRCLECFQHDGRWCERMVGHGGLHQAGTVSWGDYSRAGSERD